MACAYLLSVSNPAPSSAPAAQKEKDAAARAESAIEQIPEDLDSTSGGSEVTSPEPALGYNDDPRLPYPPGSPPLNTTYDNPLVSPVNPERSFVDALKGVLDLHTAKRMKPASPSPTSTQGTTADTTKNVPGAFPLSPKSTSGVSVDSAGKVKKQKQGVSIPSQRRWQYYWALILGGGAPKDLFVQDPTSKQAPAVSR